MKKVLLGIVIAVVLMFGGCLALVGGGLAAVDNEIKQDDQVAANGGVTSFTDDGAIEHVTIKSCDTDGFGLVTAKLVIHNEADDRATYSIDGEVLKGKRRIGDFIAFVDHVRPGQKVNVEATGTVTGSPKEIRCKLVSVERY